MGWTVFHSRAEILRTVTAVADTRLDGRLPMDVAGVREVFADELDLLGALHLTWHTRLAGHVERALMTPPPDLDAAVVGAWHATAEELPGTLAVLDHHREHPLDAAMAGVLATATARERAMLAVSAGRARIGDADAASIGAVLESRARAHRPPRPTPEGHCLTALVDRLKAVVAA